MTIDNYSPSTALDSYFPSRTERRTARVWSREKTLHDWADLGAASFFEGGGSNPTTLTGYSKNKLWLRVDAGVTDAPGTVRYFAGGDDTLLASWPEMTKAAFVAHTAARGSDLDFAWSTATTGDPGSGKVRGNHATLASITSLAISETGRGGQAYTSRVATWGANDRIRIYAMGDETAFVEFTVASGAVDVGTYYTVAGTVTGSSTIASGALLGIEHTPIGAKTGIDYETVPATGSILAAASSTAVRAATTEELETLVNGAFAPTELSIRRALGYIPAPRTVSRRTFSSAQTWYVRPDDHGVVHLSTAGITKLFVPYVTEHFELITEVDPVLGAGFIIDSGMTSILGNNIIYESNPRAGIVSGEVNVRAVQQRPGTRCVWQFRSTGRPALVAEKSRNVILRQSVTAPITISQFAYSGGYYDWYCEITLPAGDTTITVPQVDNAVSWDVQESYVLTDTRVNNTGVRYAPYKRTKAVVSAGVTTIIVQNPTVGLVTTDILVKNLFPKLT